MDTESHFRTWSRLLTAPVLLAVGMGFWLLCHRTRGANDFFESPFSWWGWIALPAIGAIAGAGRAGDYWLHAALLVGPQMLALAVLGTALHDPEEGASLWMVGETFLVVLVCLTALSGWFGALAARSRRQIP